jgi:hypothetical protein
MVMLLIRLCSAMKETHPRHTHTFARRIFVSALVALVVLSAIAVGILYVMNRTTAAEGDYAIYREATGTNTLANTTARNQTFDTTVYEGTGFSINAERAAITLADAGHYLVLYNLAWGTQSGSTRTEIQAFLQLNGSTTLPYGRSSCYQRRLVGTDECFQAGGAIIYATSTNHALRLVAQRTDSGTAIPTRFANQSGISVLKIDDTWGYIRARYNAGGQAFNSTSFATVLLDTNDEIDTSHFTRTNGDITLLEKGHYLVTYNVMFRSSVASIRNQMTRVTLNDVEVPGSRTTATIGAANSTQDHTAAWVGIVEATSSGQVLRVDAACSSETCANITSVANQVGVTVAKIPDTADYLRLYETVGGQAVDGTDDPILFDTQAEVDSAFSHSTTSNSSRMQINESGDYLFFGSFLSTRANTTVTGEQYPRWEWRLNGTNTLPYGTFGQFSEGDNGTIGAFTSGNAAGVIYRGLIADDYVELLNTDESTTADASSTFTALRYGAHAVKMSDLLTNDITVYANGSLNGTATASTTNLYVGGSFRIDANHATETVTAITITETGTVDAQTGLDNIRLYYDSDTTAPYNCESESYSGSELQFGATSTNGFSSANGTTSFSGSVTVSTSSTMCVYMVLDVTNAAADGETISIEVANPPTDITIASGSIDPAVAVTLASSTTIWDQLLTQVHYHFRNDDGSESGATSATLGVEDTALASIAKTVPTRLRLGVSNEGRRESATTTYRIEYGLRTTTCDAIASWTDIGAALGDWDMSDSGNLTEGNDTTDIAEATGGLTDENSNFVTPNGGVRDTSSQTGGLRMTTADYVDLEFSIVPTTAAQDGGTYCFRLTNGGTDIDAYSAYAEATIAADITVSATGTQTAALERLVTNQYVGGAFVVRDSSGSRTVTAITITETGTVDAQTGLDNIRLYYDSDTSAPYNCESESYSGSELQFGATDTDGFSSANGSSSFSGSVTVSTTSALCVYTVVDVIAGATNGDTLELSIASAGGGDLTVSTGSVNPNDPVTIDGASTIQGPEVHQTHFHFRNDDGTEAAASSRSVGIEDTNATVVQFGEAFRLRLQVSNEGNATTSSRQYRLEYGERTTTCAAIGIWSDVGATGGAFDMSDSTYLTNGSDTTNIATSTGGMTDENTTFKTTNGGVRDTSSQTGGIVLSTSEFAEFEYSIEATEFATFSTTYCFRLTNAGTVLESYDEYPEATLRGDQDFYVQRGFSEILGTATSVTITAGVHYTAPTRSGRAFIRITNTHHTGAGHNSGGGTQNANNVTTYIENPNNLSTSVRFRRFGTTNVTRIYWEVLEYRGPIGGDNEFIVREMSTLTFGANSLSATTSGISGISTDADVVPFITGVANPDAATTNYNSGQVTTQWASSTDTIIFNRNTAGADAVAMSYAAVEFVGTNWVIQRVEHTYSAAGSAQSEAITPVNSVARTFLHVQKRVGSGLTGQDEFGHEVWLADTSNVNFIIQTGAGSPALQTSVAWVIENTQTTGDTMVVTQSNYTQAGGVEPSAVAYDITATVSSLDNASIFTTSRSSGTGTAYPRPIMGVRLTTTSQYEVWVSDTGDTRTFRTEVVDWPTAERSIVQNYFRFYVDNNALTPTDAWPPGGTDLGENTTITGADTPPSPGSVLRVRMTIAADNGSISQDGLDFKLQYGERTTTCAAISSWSDVGGIGSTTVAWRGYNASTTDGTALSGDPATLADLKLSVADVAGTLEEENNSATNPFKVSVGEDIEYDWIIEASNTAEQTAYCFRMTESDGSVLDDYLFYPTIITAGFQITQEDWRWFDDATSTTPTIALAATNTAPADIAFGNSIKLRVALDETAGLAETNAQFKLQFSEFSDFSSGVFDVEDIDECTNGSRWCYFDGAGTNGATITAKVLGTSTDACVGGVGAGCGSHNESSYSPTAFGEVGTVTTDSVGTTVILARTYQNPVFIVESISGDVAGSATDRPAAALITATTTNSFTVRVAEPDDELDDHGNETVAYMVMEAGAHVLPDGTRIDAGRLSTASYYGNGVIGTSDDTCTFVQSFTAPPIVFAALESNRNSGTPDFLTAAVRSVTASNFACAIEVPDGETNEPTQSETIGWIAIQKGVFVNNGITFDIASTTNTVTGFATTPWNSTLFSATFEATPALTATKQTRNGAEGGWVRYGGTDATTTRFAIDERDAGDRTHTGEVVGFAAFSGSGLLFKSGTSSTYFSAGASTEYEFTIVGKDPVENTAYFFRVYDVTNDSVVSATSSYTYPSLVSEGSTLSFSIEGLNAGVTTEGVTLDATTTATSVAFGRLTFGSLYQAAHRLSVSTNAPSGYRAYALERQDLSYGAGTILDVTAPNSNPQAWATVCAATSSSCFGYHAGDNTLSGGSTRFLINDTYAALTSTPGEVAYNSGPVTNESTDIVYAIQTTANQAGGTYEADIIYIVVPTF